MLTILLILSGCYTPNCSTFRLFALHWRLQLQRCTISLTICLNMYRLWHFQSLPLYILFPAGLPTRLAPSLHHVTSKTLLQQNPPVLNCGAGKHRLAYITATKMVVVLKQIIAVGWQFNYVYTLYRSAAIAFSNINRNADSHPCCGCIFTGSCSRFCDRNGCWGPGAGDCVSCANYWRDGECVDECDVASGFYTNATTKYCLPCSEECLNTCTGPVSCFWFCFALILVLKFLQHIFHFAVSLWCCSVVM